MYSEILFAGFGGQGVILAGKILCIAAMHDGKRKFCVLPLCMTAKTFLIFLLTGRR